MRFVFTVLPIPRSQALTGSSHPLNAFKRNEIYLVMPKFKRYGTGREKRLSVKLDLGDSVITFG